MTKDAKPNPFAAERAKLEAFQSLDKFEDRCNAFEDLLKDHERLVKQAEKITRIGDSIQLKLMLAKEKIAKQKSDLEKAQTALILKEKLIALNTMTSGVAHEIRNPLNFVNNFAELLNELVLELTEDTDGFINRMPPPQREALSAELRDIIEDKAEAMRDNVEVIQKNGRRASIIIDRMIQLSFSEQDIVEEHPIDLRPLLRECVDSSGRKFTDYRELVVHHVPEHAVLLQANPKDLGCVLTQLADNAFEAVLEKKRQEPGHTCRVETEIVENEDTLRLIVRDNGDGIADEAVEKLYLPFFTTKIDEAVHLGLGLSVSFDIIARGYGGTLDHRRTDDGWTEFVVELPKGRDSSEK